MESKTSDASIQRCSDEIPLSRLLHSGRHRHGLSQAARCNLTRCSQHTSLQTCCRTLLGCFHLLLDQSPGSPATKRFTTTCCNSTRKMPAVGRAAGPSARLSLSHQVRQVCRGHKANTDYGTFCTCCYLIRCYVALAHLGVLWARRRCYGRKLTCNL